MFPRRYTLCGLAAIQMLAFISPLPAHARQQSTPAADTQYTEHEAAHVFTILQIRPDALRDFLPVMQANAAGSRQESGNISFDVFQGEDGGDGLLLFESWNNRAAHSRHMTLPHFKAVGARENTDFTSSPVSIWVKDVPGLPGHIRKPIPNAATTRNVIVRLRVKPEQRDTFLKGFAEVIPQARSAPGNYIFELYQDVDAPNSFVLLERWQSVAAHEAHLAQPYSKKLDGIIPATLAGQPERHLLRDAAP